MNNIDRIQFKEFSSVGFNNPTFGIIGMGNIGRAAAIGLAESGLLSKGQLWISNKNYQETENKCKDLINLDKVTLAQTNKDLVQNCNVVFVALKQTQMREELMRWNKSGILDTNILLISFAAGVRIDTIKKWVGNSTQPVVRVMPNTPVAVGKGVFGWTVSDEVTVGQIKTIKNLLGTLGTEFLTKSDENIDIITAISGSGPAYFYLFAEEIVQEAVEMGFNFQEAENLVRQTFIGAAALLDKSQISFSELRQRITSKGGTTEQAINSFNSHDLSSIVADAMKSAKNRASELGHYFDSL